MAKGGPDHSTATGSGWSGDLALMTTTHAAAVRDSALPFAAASPRRSYNRWPILRIINGEHLHLPVWYRILAACL